MTAVTINGNTYSDDGTEAKDMRNMGHATHFLPLVADVVVVAGEVADDADQVSTDAAQVAADKALAQGYANSASASASTATTKSDLAVAAWASASNQTQTLVAVDTSFFPSTTLVTAKLFTTRNDYKGGEWRKQCQDKSWYNETIYGNQIGVGYYANEAAARAVSGATTNDYYYDTTAGLFKALNAGSGITTIYRGGRREFPENFIVTVESARVVIWDCDFGAPRMWMVGSAGVSSRSMFGYVNTFTSAAYKSGVLVISATTASNLGLIKVNFIEDAAYGYNQTLNYGGKCNNSIANRNSETNAYNWGTGNSLALVSQACNAVAITTLENAPLDAYGIPKPTIVVGTDGGVTVLGWDGVADNVAWDIYETSGPSAIKDVFFREDGKLGFAWSDAGDAFNTYAHVGFIPVPTADVTASYYYLISATGFETFTYIASGGATAGPAAFPDCSLSTQIKKITKNCFATNTGISKVVSNPTTPPKSLIAYITHTYNSGWLIGDIKAAITPNSAGTLADRSIKARTVTGTYTTQAAASGADLLSFTGSTDITLTLDADVSATGELTFWEKVSGVWYQYVNDLSGGTDYVDGASGTASAHVTLVGTTLTFLSGYEFALGRASGTVATAQQVREIYETEKKLFESNAKAYLAGTSSAVLAVDHDDITGVTSVLTSYGRSDIKGLVRVASEATAVGTPKAVSALGGAILQVGSTGVDYYAPAKNLREELPTDLGDKPRQLFDFDLSSATTCTLPQGWKPTGAVWSAGAKKRYGAAKDFLTSYDGFLWSVVMNASTTAWVQVEGEKE